VQPYYGQTVDRMPQYCTERVLRARAAEIDGVELFYGWSFEAMTQDDRGVGVEIVADGQRKTLRGRYLVGCDGSRSSVREAAGITQTRSEHDRKMVLLVLRSHELHDLLGELYEPRAFYNALVPGLDGYWNFLGRVDADTEWFYHAPVPEETTRENTDFAALLHSAVGRPFPLEITHVGFWELRVALADRYQAGRVLIAGDACHSHPPYGGYGVNTGFEDARNLGWKLVATLRGWGGAALLDSYDAERRPVFASTAKDFIERFIREDRAFLRDHSPERDPEAFARAWYARNEGASEVFAFEPNYEGSPIIGGPGRPSAKGDHRFEARAGHHLAPRELSDGMTTYQALGPGFTLFAFGQGEDAAAFASAAEAREIPFSAVEDGYEGERRDYGSPLILVRPDGFVAWAGAAGDADAILARATGAVRAG
jgi:2-polyprenyl-6-methoxyphenol hydroxylase-like FAD-dependent oxidoreductase